MADGEDQDLILDENMEIEDGAEALPPEDQQAGEDELIIELEGEAASEEPPLVKKLRQEIRERDRKLAERQPAQEADIVVGDKPTLESCEYDEEKFNAEYDGWMTRKAAADRQQQSRQSAEQQRANEFRDLEVRYRASAAKLGARPEDFDAADAAVRAALPEPVQIAIAKYMDDPAKVVLALGKHPARLDAIAAEPDPVRQLFMIRDLQGAIKVTTRRAAPPPEADSIQRGSASMSAQVDKQADKLLSDALKTGNMTAYNKYMKAKKKAA